MRNMASSILELTEPGGGKGGKGESGAAEGKGVNGSSDRRKFDCRSQTHSGPAKNSHQR